MLLLKCFTAKSASPTPINLGTAGRSALLAKSTSNISDRPNQEEVVQPVLPLAIPQCIPLPGPLPHTIGIHGVSRHVHSILQGRFTNLVMCDFTPRRPNELPMARWASYKELARLFEKYADVRRIGPGNLKQMIIAW